MGEQILTKRNSKDIFHADGKLSQMESQLKERMKKKKENMLVNVDIHKTVSNKNYYKLCS